MLNAPTSLVSERLADGSVLIVRDRMHPAPQPPGTAPQPPVTAPQPPGTAPQPPGTAPQPPGEPLGLSSAARRSGVSFDGAAAAGSEPFRTGSAVPSEPFRPARRTGGVQIRGPVFAEDA